MLEKPRPVVLARPLLLPKDPKYFSESIQYVNNSSGIERLVEFAQQRPLSHIGFDTDLMVQGHSQLLSISMVELQGDGLHIYNFVIDLRGKEYLGNLQPLFDLSVCFVSHNLKRVLFFLWEYGLSAPAIVWDTSINEKVLHLGKNNIGYLRSSKEDLCSQIRAKADKKATDQFQLSLLGTCQRYGVPYRDYQCIASLSKLNQFQLDIAIEDARAAARLYLPQVNIAAQHGLLHHLTTVEMPWAITNAKIQWKGVKIDCAKRDDTFQILQAYQSMLEDQLSQLGINDHRNNDQLITYFNNLGLLHLFKKNDGYSFDHDQLKQLQSHHPTIKALRNLRRISSLLDDKILMPELVKNGRIQPNHIQLGTDTGRQTSEYPNILGMDALLRPLIIPEVGYGIGEVDWSQNEIGIAAAIYGDETLIKMFNTGDVYSAMARHFFVKELPEDLTDQELKDKYPNYRKIMKECTLGILYGMTPYGLAAKLNIKEWVAKSLQARFFEMFPQLQLQLQRLPKLSAIRGYATTISGLRRNRGIIGPPTNWELNWLSNHPIQGSAAVIFKVAGNRLAKLYERYDAHLIIPLHDSFVFEAPLNHLKVVAELTERVMCEAVQEYFPMLKPKAEINISNPDCWNKGDLDPLGKWLAKILESKLI